MIRISSKGGTKLKPRGQNNMASNFMVPTHTVGLALNLWRLRLIMGKSKVPYLWHNLMMDIIYHCRTRRLSKNQEPIAACLGGWNVTRKSFNGPAIFCCCCCSVWVSRSPRVCFPLRADGKLIAKVKYCNRFFELNWNFYIKKYIWVKLTIKKLTKINCQPLTGSTSKNSPIKHHHIGV